MFRPNTGIDLNDFPALGTPAASNSRATPTVPPQTPSSLLPSNRFANYPSTPSNSNHLQDALLGSGAVSDFPSSSPYQPVAAYGGAASDHALAAAVAARGGGGGPRTYSMDEFPALRSSTAAAAAGVPFGNEMANVNAMNSKPEPWDYYYAGARDAMPESLNGK